MLDELRVRVVAEEELDFGEDKKAPVFHITLTGLRKLRDHGYNTDLVVDLGSNTEFCALANPDKLPALAGVDPAKIKLFDIAEWNGNNGNKKVMRDMVEKILTPVIDCHTRVSVPHGRVEELNTDKEWFHIHIWSSPERGRYETPRHMWGIENPNRDSGDGIGVWMGGCPVTTDEGFEVAAFDKRNLYIYFDLVHHHNDRVFKIMEHIFKVVAEFYNKPLKHDIEMVKGNYVKACRHRYEKEKKEIEKFLKKAVTDVANLQQSLTRKLREARTYKVRLEAMTASVEDVGGRIATEFDRLLAMDKVVSVNWRANKLVVTTKRLFCVHPKKNTIHDIGAFDLVVDSDNANMQFWNRTRRVDAHGPAMNGPHLFPDGRACLGNMDAVIPVLVANYEWAAAIQQAIAFIESVNLDDSAGRHIGKWPTVTKKEMEKLQQEPETEEEAIAEAAKTVAEAEAAAEAAPEAVAVAAEPDADEATEAAG
jgi:hypothetical protein